LANAGATGYFGAITKAALAEFWTVYSVPAASCGAGAPGSASAVVGCTQLSVAGIGSGIAAYLYDSTTLPLHVFTLACCVCAALLWLAGHRIRHPTVVQEHGCGTEL